MKIYNSSSRLYTIVGSDYNCDGTFAYGVMVTKTTDVRGGLGAWISTSMYSIKTWKKYTTAVKNATKDGGLSASYATQI